MGNIHDNEGKSLQEGRSEESSLGNGKSNKREIPSKGAGEIELFKGK